MFALIPYIFQCTKRDKIFISLLLCIILSFFITYFIGSTAAYEQEQMQIVYSSGIFRLIFVYGFAIFNTFFVVRMFQTREIEAFLAGPISRHCLILSIFCVNIILIASLIFFASSLLKICFYNIISFSHILIWFMSVFFETVIVSMVAVFFALMLNNATTSILMVTIFYIVSRMMGFIISSITFQLHNIGLMNVVEYTMVPLSFFFPRFDLFSQSIWLIYNEPVKNLLLIIMQSLVYISLILCASIVDFNKKNL